MFTCGLGSKQIFDECRSNYMFPSEPTVSISWTRTGCPAKHGPFKAELCFTIANASTDPL